MEESTHRHAKLAPLLGWLVAIGATDVEVFGTESSEEGLDDSLASHLSRSLVCSPSPLHTGVCLSLEGPCIAETSPWLYLCATDEE